MTALIPARDEAASLADTIASLRAQSRPPDRVIVIDDASADATGRIAAAHGATVLRLQERSGSKGAALNAALDRVETDLVLVVDADIVLAPDALGRLMAPLRDPQVAAACGQVKPRRVRTVWERARLCEYLFSAEFIRPLQDRAGAFLVLTGCFTLYRTSVLRRHGGWRSQSIAEDMDLTWTLLRAGHRLRYVRDSVCYSLEPESARLMRRQLRRWSHGFCQTLKLHWPGVLAQPRLRAIVVVWLCTVIADALLFFVLTPLLAVLVHPLFLLLLGLDFPVLWPAIAIFAWRQGELRRVLPSLPCMVAQRFLQSWVFAGAVWAELVRGRAMHEFQKGH